MISNQKQKQEYIINKPQISNMINSPKYTKERFEIIKRKVKNQIFIRIESNILK